MKKKLLLTSILSVIMCISLIAGATFALFTSEDNVNIAVTSATVKVSAEIDESSVQTKQLNQDYVSGVNGLFEGEAVFTTDANDVQTLTLDRLVPGDAIKFNIVVKNSSNVTVKYRTVISCLNDDGLFAGLNVNIGDIQNYNGDKYVANWQVMEEGSQDIIIPVVIELPEDAGNEYQTKTCTLNYFVEAVQGNAKTENVSTGVEVNGATEDAVLKTNGADSPEVVVPVELLSNIAGEVEKVSLKHSEPIIENNTVSFAVLELVDENGDVIDLEALNNDKPITVKFNVGDAFNEGETVIVYHDGEAIATAVVDADKNITYTATHFCEVKVAFGDGKIDSIIELKNAFDKAQNGDTILFGGDITSVEGILIDSKNLTVDLNGYTYTVTDGANVNSRAFKIIGSANVTVKNGTIIAEGNISSGAYGSVRAEGSAKVTLDSLVLRNYRGGGLNVKVCAGTEVTINNCEIYAQYGGGVEADGGNVVLNNTKIDQKGVYGNGWYSVALVGHSGGKITVNSGEYSGQAIETDSNASMGNCVAFTLSSGCTLDIYGGKFTAKVAEEKIAANFCGVIYADRAANVNIYGGTFISNGAILDMRNNSGSAPNPVATIYGGTFSADPSVSGLYSSNLIKLNDGYIVVKDEGAWTVVKGDVIEVATAEEFKANILNKTNKKIVLTNDITLDKGLSESNEYINLYTAIDLNGYDLIFNGAYDASKVYLFNTWSSFVITSSKAGSEIILGDIKLIHLRDSAEISNVKVTRVQGETNSAKAGLITADGDLKVSNCTFDVYMQGNTGEFINGNNSIAVAFEGDNVFNIVHKKSNFGRDYFIKGVKEEVSLAGCTINVVDLDGNAYEVVCEKSTTTAGRYNYVCNAVA